MSEVKTVESVKYFTTKEAAKEAGINVQKIRSAICRGKLIAKQIPDSSHWGYHYLIPDYELLSWVEDPRKSRCEPPSNFYKNQKKKKAPTSSNIEDLIKDLVSKIEEHVYSDAFAKGQEAGYEKGYKDGKLEAAKALKDLIGDLKE